MRRCETVDTVSDDEHERHDRHRRDGNMRSLVSHGSRGLSHRNSRSVTGSDTDTAVTSHVTYRAYTAKRT